MNILPTFVPETADDFFGELIEVSRLQADCRNAYEMLNRIFMRCVNQKTNFAGVRFGGTFAKVDFLLKKHHAPPSLHRRVNDARVRLRKQRELSDGQLAHNLSHDLKAVCQFVGLVFGTPVPAMLAATFPQDRMTTKGELQGECLRVVVNRWDDTFVYADADTADGGEVKVFYGGKAEQAVYKDWDWSYLHDLLYEGCQLNLVRPRMDQGILYCELIVWEPDYLVDISAIAACFESYGNSPLIHLLNKLKPAPCSEAIVLGNMASLFLDEAMCDDRGERPYSESVRQFFRNNALSLLMTPLSDDFHAKAQQQQKNIRRAVFEQLPALLDDEKLRFDASQAMVEPSFFSEMLGLQGRMDMLQLDYRLLIEQKSGKGAFPETDPPQQQEKHYVQLLLYMLLLRYNFRDEYEKNHHELHALLFYSKYSKGLVPLGFAPRLVFEAMKVRNGIAANEYAFTRGGLDVLKTLSADNLNTNHTRGVLWQRYQKPQLEAVLAPIQAASELERAYFVRMLTFLETEHLLAKVGCQTKENAGFADKWHSTLADKLLAGNIYCGLRLESPTVVDVGKVERVVLGFTEKPEHDIANFRVGDIVILYPYSEGQEPDVRRTMVFRASIESIGADSIALQLRAAQTDARVFWRKGNRLWAIEHDFIEASFSALYRGMHSFLTAPRERRDLLLLQRKPHIDTNLRLRGDYGPFNDLALRVKQSIDLFLIIGPPGTGKTSFGLLNTLKEQLMEPQTAVLLLSYTNRAVDEICGKLTENSIDFIRIGGKNVCEAAYRPYLLDNKVEGVMNLGQLRQIVAETRVFVGTTTALSANLGLLGMKRFDLAIIDEASQILEPHLMGLLSAKMTDGTSAIKKMVLIGDHKQLPAVVQQREDESEVSDPALRSIHLTNCRMSLFERLLRQYRNDSTVVYMLTRQGRMHHDIARWPSAAFYESKLREVPLEHQKAVLPAHGDGKNGIDDLLATRRVAFVVIEPTGRSVSDKVNSSEAEAIAATLVRIYWRHRDTFNPLQTVGVIVPYRNQIAEIRSWVERSGIDALRDVTIDTVERFQGSQRDCIIYGFTIQKYYQLEFLTSNVFIDNQTVIDRKLNVAMTRARKHLLLFGDPSLLARNTTFAQLMDYMKDTGSYLSVPQADYVAGRFRVE